MTKIITLLLLLLTSLLVVGQQKFSTEQLKADVDTLVKRIEETHVNPYTCISKKDFHEKANALKESIHDSLSRISFYALVAPLVSSINDGHTGVKPLMQEWLAQNPSVCPLDVRISYENKIEVKHTFKRIPKGAEIKSINGISSEEIVKKLSAYISAESYAYRIHHLNRSFIFYFELTYGEHKQLSFAYESDGVSNTIIVECIPYNELVDLRLSNRKKQKQEPYTLSYVEDNTIALLDFKRFEDIEGFRAFLDTAFREIRRKNIDHLIIDLRQNGGGNSQLGDELFQYISPCPFAQFGTMKMKVSTLSYQLYDKKRTEGFLSHISDSIYNSYFHQPKGTVIKENGGKMHQLRKNDWRFKGNVYLLTSVQSFSSATDFAWCFKHFNMGEIIGQTTGGYIVSFGDLIYTQLPNTKLPIYISHKEFYGYGATQKHRHGVVPHHELTPNQDALDYTINRIQKNQ